MANKNTSDSIEAYIKALLAQAGIRIGKVQFSDQHQMLEELGASIGEQISQTVFGDILQMLFEEKLLTKREAELLSVTTTDEVLGSEAHRLRANILRKIIQQVDRKGM